MSPGLFIRWFRHSRTSCIPTALPGTGDTIAKAETHPTSGSLHSIEETDSKIIIPQLHCVQQRHRILWECLSGELELLRGKSRSLNLPQDSAEFHKDMVEGRVSQAESRLAELSDGRRQDGYVAHNVWGGLWERCRCLLEPAGVGGVVSRLGTTVKNSVFILKKLRESTEGFKQRRDVMRSAFWQDLGGCGIEWRTSWPLT